MEGGSDEKNLKLMSSTKNKTKPLPVWIKNWDISTRQRKNGRFDKYYYHKETNIMCRSLVEAENYELYGILPGHLRRAKKERENNQNPSIMQIGNKNASGQENEMCLPSSNIPNAKMKEEVEKFLKESYENLNKASAVKSHEHMVASGSGTKKGYLKISSSTIPKAKMKEEVEKFLKESYENLNKASAVKSHEHMVASGSGTKKGYLKISSSTIPNAKMKEKVEKFLKESYENLNKASAIKSHESHEHMVASGSRTKKGYLKRKRISKGQENEMCLSSSNIPDAKMKEEVEKILNESKENLNKASAVKSDEQSYEHKEEVKSQENMEEVE
ncbi:hypothetical protein GH714_021866 [Hevea brasiliensis]|uniref:MBD domain-containing protein n=1 Tax=Hevea brasiliensis TaxID=3981 RepID=A0A6A6L8R0_HEVBR|nr:hypothetical protein GH714_021749 [Hevea brasiliensis]KAF2297354.1 hypothetical protein GH714_021866 [Hevea brasiliensis]